MGAPGTIKSPAQHGGEGETAKGSGEKQVRPVPKHSPESAAGQDTAHIRAIGDIYPGDQDHQSGEGTNDDGVQKYLDDPQEPLLRGVRDLSAGVGHGSCPHPGFVGEDSPGASYPKDLKSRADDTACNGPGRKSTGEDLSESAAHHIPPKPKANKAQQDVCPGNERDQKLRGGSDPFCSPQQHGTQGDGHQQSDAQRLRR